MMAPESPFTRGVLVEEDTPKKKQGKRIHADNQQEQRCSKEVNLQSACCRDGKSLLSDDHHEICNFNRHYAEYMSDYISSYLGDITFYNDSDTTVTMRASGEIIFYEESINTTTEYDDEITFINSNYNYSKSKKQAFQLVVKDESKYLPMVTTGKVLMRCQDKSAKIPNHGGELASVDGTRHLKSGPDGNEKINSVSILCPLLGVPWTRTTVLSRKDTKTQ